MSDRPLSVTVSVKGRFHGFDLARQLHERGMLGRLITTYPKFKIREWGIPDGKSSSILAQEFLSRVVGRVPLSSRKRQAANFHLAVLYDHAASERIPPETSLFVGWSGSSTKSLRRAKSLGARTIIERGSTHIGFQDRILRDEYERLGLVWEGIDPRSIETEAEDYEATDFISVPSAFVRDTFVQYGVTATKILVIPYGCDLTIFKPRPKLDKIFRIIHCGQISVQKGVHILIKAFAELRLPDSELWLIGGMTPEIANILQRYPDSRIIVKGPFPQRLLPEYYSQGSVFCIGSVQEGLAMVIPQAMSCGLPVIATVNSGAAEIVENGRTGFVIVAGSVEALKEKILLLFQNSSLREEMAANLLAPQRASLSWSRYGEQIAEAYKEIAAQEYRAIPVSQNT